LASKTKKPKKFSMGDRLLIANYKLAGLTKSQCIEILCYYGHDHKSSEEAIIKFNKWRAKQ